MTKLTTRQTTKQTMRLTVKRISRSTSRRTSKKALGLIYIFTGDGKGKTSAALGMLTRALAHSWRVGWISWYKEKSWGISEHGLTRLLNAEAKRRLTFLPMGKGFFLKGSRLKQVNEAVVVDKATVQKHKVAARQALNKAVELISKVDVLFLDEVCNAVFDKLLEEKAVVALLKKRGKTHVVLTGRNASVLLKKVADLVSVVKKEKHPFDKGMLAVKGLDF